MVIIDLFFESTNQQINKSTDQQINEYGIDIYQRDN